MDRRGRRRVPHDPYVQIIIMRIVQSILASDYWPPTTLALLAGNVWVHYTLDPIVPTVRDACLQPYTIHKYWDYKRLMWSSFLHGDDTHLWYNMASLVWKGLKLERDMGTLAFARLVAFLLVVSQALEIYIPWVLAHFTGYTSPYVYGCSIGFSSVLFGLKVILNTRSPPTTYVPGWGEVPTRYVVWLELILAQWANPMTTSFLGHFAGILAGLLYLYAAGILTGRLPSWVLRLLPFNRFPGTGRRAARDPPRPTGRAIPIVWTCRRCTFDNSRHLPICEMCGAPK
ncbi:hypothetical protein HDU85_003990 [Gaertneriomyces sp. JEL0708]|nr:hypothetical protein HDU85_003990 [Gaertneriomyces sp. JEL0708]